MTHIHLLRPQCIVMNDASLTLMDLPYRFRTCSNFSINRFGNFVAGKDGIVSINIRVFGAPIEATDAFIQILMDTGKTRGLHAKVTNQYNGTNFKNRNIRGLGAGGECPICLETGIRATYPIQKFRCGHGCCTECLLNYSSTKIGGGMTCMTCRALIQTKDDRLIVSNRMFESWLLRGDAL